MSGLHRIASTLIAFIACLGGCQVKDTTGIMNSIGNSVVDGFALATLPANAEGCSTNTTVGIFVDNSFAGLLPSVVETPSSENTVIQARMYPYQPEDTVESFIVYGGDTHLGRKVKGPAADQNGNIEFFPLSSKSLSIKGRLKDDLTCEYQMVHDSSTSHSANWVGGMSMAGFFPAMAAAVGALSNTEQGSPAATAGEQPKDTDAAELAEARRLNAVKRSLQNRQTEQELGAEQLLRKLFGASDVYYVWIYSIPPEGRIFINDSDTGYKTEIQLSLAPKIRDDIIIVKSGFHPCFAQLEVEHEATDAITKIGCRLEPIADRVNG